MSGAKTYTWIGGTGPANKGTLWSPSGGPPGPGDSAIISSGTVLVPNDSGFQDNTIYLGSAAIDFTGDNGVSNFNPTLDYQTTITSAADNAALPAEASVLNSGGVFISQGDIAANGTAGSTFTINIHPTGTGSATVPGYFINYNLIEVDAGNAMTIAIGSGSELFNAGEILVNSGSLFLSVDSKALAGGVGPVVGGILIDNGGTVETQASYGTATTGSLPIYAFGTATSGNALKIDNTTSFGGEILGFGVGDTIDLAGVTGVSQVVYDANTGILVLQGTSSATLASLYFGSGNFTGGTVSGGVAGSFGVTPGASGDTLLTTTVPIHVYNNTSGSWQQSGNWTNGTPSPTDSAFIGAGASSPFTLTTGTVGVTVGALTLEGDSSTLQIASNTTVGPYVLNGFGGLIDVNSGITLTATDILLAGGTLQVDPTAHVSLSGHAVPAHIGAVNGTITTGNTYALQVPGGTVLVNGGSIGATTTLTNGGTISIGADGGGTPATVTVQNDGSGHAGTVVANYTVLSSDPTSSGELILDGSQGAGVFWHDQTNVNASTGDSGRIIVGSNDEFGNSGSTLAAPAISGPATLLVENGATLTDDTATTGDTIGATANSSGNVTIQSNGIWNLNGTAGLGVGFMGNGSLSVLNGGTVNDKGGVTIGSATVAANGTLLVSGAHSQFNVAGGINDGKSGQGVLQVLNGGTVQINGGGINAGANSGASGSVLVSGTDTSSGAVALIKFGANATGITIGGGNGTIGGQGTLTISNLGTVQMFGTKGIAVGQSAGVGLLTVSGTGALLNEGSAASGLSVGQSGTGTLQVLNGGGVTINAGGLAIGNTASADTTAGVGTVTVSGTGSTINMAGKGAISVGSPGSGVLTIGAGGSVAASGGVLIATNTLSSSGVVTVNTGGTLSDAGALTIGSNGSGTLSVQGGLVQNTGSNAIAVGGGGALASGLLVINGGTVTDPAGFTVGNNNASGTVEVEAGTLSTTGTGTAAAVINATSSGQAVAIVSGGTWTTDALTIGTSGSGTLSVQGGLVKSTGTNGISVGGSITGNSAHGLLVINGGTVTDSGSFNVGNSDAFGTLEVEAGLLSTTGSFFPSINASGTGQAVAIVTGGTWSTNGLSIGGGGTGSLDINTAGLVLSSGTSGIGIGTNSGGSGTLTIENKGSLSANGGLIVAGPTAGVSQGSVTIGDGGTATVGALTVGAGGIVTVGGTASAAVLSSGGIVIGQNGTGAALVVNQFGTVTEAGPPGLSIGLNSGTTGTLTVNGGTVTSSGGISVGQNGSGTLTINSGQVTNSGTNIFSINAGGVFINGGTLSDDNDGFSLRNGSLQVKGSGQLITGGGTAFSDISATGSGQAAAVLVSGGTWTSNGSIIVGDGSSGSAGTGSIDINSKGLLNASTNSIFLSMGTGGAAGVLSLESGGSLQAGTLTIGQVSTLTTVGTGTLTVAGGTAQLSSLQENGGGTISVSSGSLSVSGNAIIGQNGTGAALTMTGGNVTTGALTVSQSSGGTGGITVSGGTLTANGAMTIGNQGNGLVTVNTGGTLNAAGGLQVDTPLPPPIGPGNGTLMVNGGYVSTTGTLAIGTGGTAIVNVGSNGTFAASTTATVAPSFAIGNAVTGVASVIVDDATFTTSGAPLFVGGNTGKASLQVQNAGTVITTFNGGGPAVDISGFGQPSVTVTGTNSVWQVLGTNAVQFIIGDNSGSKGSLSITDGAVVNAGTANTVDIANQTNSTGTVNVTGGTLIAGILDISPTGTASGSLNVGIGGVIQVTSATINGGGVVSLSGGLFDPTTSVSLGSAGTINGFGKLDAGVTDNGLITASSGILDITGGITGTGTLSLNNAATLQADGSIAINPTVSFNTGINETLILGNPGSLFTNTINGLAETDQIDFNFGGGRTITSASLINSTTINVATNAGSYALTNVNFAPSSATGLTWGTDKSTGDQFIQIVCFARGTQIRTPVGEVAVERLAVGDTVQTFDGKAKPIVWIGVGRVLVTPGRRSAATPVIVRKGALADNVPCRDLRVTKGHSLFIDDVLIPVEFLVNHRSITWDDRAREIEIYHVELAQHGVLVAEGAPAESYRDDGNRWLFHNANATWHLPPLPPCAPVLTGGAIVDAAWRRLLDRSGPRPGLPLTDEPDLHLLVDGQRLDSHARNGDVHMFRLPQRPTSVRIVSRAGAPDELGVARDPRQLGVALRQIKLSHGARQELIDASDPALDAGFHLFEATNGFRWTDGDATLPGELLVDIDGPCELQLHVACTTQYPLFEDPVGVAA